MAWTRAALGLGIAVVTMGALVSGGASQGPRTPAGLPGNPPPFLGTAVVGSGGLTAAIDAYGDVVDLRVPGPAGRALIDNPAARQAAGTVSPDTGIVTRVSIDGARPMPLWRADAVRQRYLPGTNVVRTEARFGDARVEIVTAAAGKSLERCVKTSGQGGGRARVTTHSRIDGGAPVACRGPLGRRAIRRSAVVDRRWLAAALPLGPGAPRWARRLYERSLLVLHALTDRDSGAVAAGARDRWAHVWPRDAATVALAFSAAGYRGEARRVASFLGGLNLGAAARFDGEGAPGRRTRAAGGRLGLGRGGHPRNGPTGPPWPPELARAARLPGEIGRRLPRQRHRLRRGVRSTPIYWEIDQSTDGRGDRGRVWRPAGVGATPGWADLGLGHGRRLGGAAVRAATALPGSANLAAPGGPT